MKSIKKVSQNPEAPWLILLHGYGADAADLSGIISQMGLAKQVNWLFPEASHEAPSTTGGRAWFSIPAKDLDHLKTPNHSPALQDHRPPGSRKARETVKREIERLKVPWERIIIGGFSQGAMLATDLALSLETPPMGLLLFSCGILIETEWKKSIDRFSSLDVFLAHGKSDDIIHFREAEKLADLFQSNDNVRLKFVSFYGGHEIPASIAAEAGRYVKGRLT